MAIEVGQEAPDFNVRSHSGTEVRLSDFRGKQNVVLVFYPFTFTGVCQGELCSIRDNPAAFKTADAQVMAISCDSTFAQSEWATQQGYDFPLLSDFWPHGAVSMAYGVFDDKLGCATRATFVIDKKGVVTDVLSSPNLGTPREKAAYDAALAKLA